MLEAALWGFVGASALIVAAELAFGIHFSRRVVGLIMAFGVGALISSVAFELMVPALQSAPGWQVALSAAGGSLVFFLGDLALGGEKNACQINICRIGLEALVNSSRTN